ncbi:hypothetical protein M2405_004133 [Rhodococcus erythropolis]|nr:hypothetical protein [Rhodococcus erythropolis]MCS4255830.1 hypothetical protein [Rhodococcus erythropolis]MCW2425347.1 hypothetical protein [Rhodococcus erythropolis]
MSIAARVGGVAAVRAEPSAVAADSDWNHPGPAGIVMVDGLSD